MAALLRTGWVVARYAPNNAWNHLQYPDEEAYVLSAQSLAAGHGFTDEFGFRATYMPGYPVYLSIFIGSPKDLFWARIVQSVLAAWIAPATYLLTRRFLSRTRRRKTSRTSGSFVDWDFGDSVEPVVEPPPAPWFKDAPFLAGLFAAIDPFLIFFSGLL